MTELHIDMDVAQLVRPTDAQVDALAVRAARTGAVLPQVDAHFVTWLHGRTSADVARQRAERIRANRDLTKRPGWTLDLAVVVDGDVVGLQSLSGFDQWPHRRVVGTTSWLLAPFQSQGLGTRSRAAVLELAFGHLRAEAAKSWALEDNHSSNAVSAKLGYQRIDRHILVENGREFAELVWELTSSRWLNSHARHQYPVTITGADEVVIALDGP